MLCALEYCTDKSNGKVWVLHRENRNIGRLRENGCYIDAPEVGGVELRSARNIAIDMPAMMFFQQNGEMRKMHTARIWVGMELLSIGLYCLHKRISTQ